MNAYAAAVSEHPDAATAAGEVIGEVLEQVGSSPELAVLFASAAHLEAFAEMAAAVRSALAPRTLIGSSAISVIGGPREVEERPAVSLWAAASCPAQPLRLQAVRGPDGWSVHGLPPQARGSLLLLADPFTFPCEALLENCEGLTVIGGLASAAGAPGGNRLLLDDEELRDGAVGALLGPEVAVKTVVSQGCRPIGQPFIVTRAERNLLHELAGQPALQRLQETLGGLDAGERELVARGLHVGVVIDEHKEAFDRGDFLIRGVVGADQESGTLAIGDVVPAGTTVQFQVRDADSADEDLRALMNDASASAALVFTCNGRGQHLFTTPHHDASVVHEALGRVPVAGMFCAGEVGPIGGQNFLHGFTASVALFGD